MRAMCYHTLALRFTKDYEPESAATDLGLPLVLVVDPNAKPSRSTLQETYDLIKSDIAQARQLMTREGEADSQYLTKDVIDALEARVDLYMHNYSEAISLSKNIMAKYPLASTTEELTNMFLNDSGSEIIFRIFSSVDERENELPYYLYWNTTVNHYGPDFIPSQWVVDLYENGDLRKGTYFLQDTIVCNDRTAADIYMLNKYPGNPDLRTSNQSNYYNTFKPIRLAEMYLIAAEAAVQSDATGEDAASNWLNPLREHRGLAALETVTLADVQEERYREMMLEGTRLTDLKRWKLPMDRGECQSGYVGPDDYGAWTNGSYVSDLGTDLVKESGDYMFVWPIPADEIFASPQFAAQQNPGWSR